MTNEQEARLHLMATGDGTWGLSPNDAAAVAAALAELARLRALRDLVLLWDSNDVGENEFFDAIIAERMEVGP